MLFSPTMVEALLAGRKEVTRRLGLLYRLNAVAMGRNRVDRFTFHKGIWSFYAKTPEPIYTCKCLYNEGGRLWVRERWRTDVSLNKLGATELPKEAPIEFFTGDTKVLGGRWRQSIFMPRRFHRIDLDVLNVTPQRLHDMVEADFTAEGVEVDSSGCVRLEGPFAPWTYLENHQNPTREQLQRAIYAALWDSLNEEPGCTWKKNPWVFVIKFRKVPPSVPQVPVVPATP